MYGSSPGMQYQLHFHGNAYLKRKIKCAWWAWWCVSLPYLNPNTAQVMTASHWRPSSPVAMGELQSSRCGITGSCCSCKPVHRRLRPYGHFSLTWNSRKVRQPPKRPSSLHRLRKGAANIACFITTWPVYRGWRVSPTAVETKRNFISSS